MSRLVFTLSSAATFYSKRGTERSVRMLILHAIYRTLRHNICGQLSTVATVLQLKSLGLAVKHWRNIAGLSQNELADAAGVHRTYISDIENGRRNLTLEILFRVAQGLNQKLSRITATAELLAEPEKTDST